MMQPPTDNLYKFLAIFGLLVFGFSWYVPLQRLEDYSREVAKWNAAWRPMVLRAREEDDDARLELDCAISVASKKAGMSRSRECIAVDASRAQRKAATRDFLRAMEELQAGKGMLDQLAAQFAMYRQIAVASGAFGLLLCVVGFWLWYVRVQRPLDNTQAKAPV